MLLTVHDVTPDKLTNALITLIEAEDDLTQPRHIRLIQLIHGMSGWGFPVLIESAQAVLNRDNRWLSASLRSLIL